MLGPATAAAHVEVLPGAAQAGLAERFTVRVPSERAVDTVAVEVLFPEQIAVYAVQAAPGWRARVLYRPDRRMRGVVFRGGRIGEGEFEEFGLLGTPQAAGTAVWRARQTYADGVVKRWTGPPEEPGTGVPESGPDQPGPASATQIAVGAGSAAPGDGDSDSQAAIWLGIVAIGVAGGAAVGVGLLWATRPARLPEDEE
jgi:uncharacterized protein YcnI